jgi:hypothetical protein
MVIFKKYRRSQKLLLGPSLDKSVPEDGEISLINEVVNALDLLPLLTRYEGDGPMVGTRSFRIRLL